MKNEKLLFVLLFNLIFIKNVFGGPVREADIPLPEVQYELPETIIGEFIIIHPRISLEITIYPNNKFTYFEIEPHHSGIYKYGYIILKNDRWYLNLFEPTTRTLLSPYTEILLTETGFSFTDKNGNVNLAIRKPTIIEPNMIANAVSVQWRKVKQQYYAINQPELQQIIDFGEISKIESISGLYHILDITDGVIRINLAFDQEMNSISGRNIITQTRYQWKGFFEIISETVDGIRSIIKFMNGVSYYYTDGSAVLIISDEQITVILQCSPEIEERVRGKIPDLQSPVFLVLEF